MAKKNTVVKLVHSEPNKKRVIALRDMDLAHEIQKHLLPKFFPFPEHIQLGTIYQPSQFIGGDFYDVLKIDDRRVAFIIGDVSGHSIPAALFMTQCMALLRTFLTMELSLTKVVEKTNKILIEIAKPDMFASVFVAIYDSHYNHLSYVNAGHNPPILVRTPSNIPQSDAHSLMMLTADGMALNCLPNMIVEEKKLQLYNEDLLLLYTDGIIETQNGDGNEYGESKLKGLLIELRDQPASDIAKELFERIMKYGKYSPVDQDDMAALVLKIKEES
jgi:phosphoserine phosphatase RsbU/P